MTHRALPLLPLLGLAFVLLGAALGPSVARADQCAYVSEAVAVRAAESLALQHKVAEYCEPCGDKRPGLRVFELAKAGPVDGADPYWEVTLEGAVIVGPTGGSQMEASLSGSVAVDLAYVYVPIGFGDWKNLALLANCPTTGVSPAIPEPIGADRLKVRDQPPKGHRNRRRRAR